MRFLHWVWLPVVDAFLTLAACPPPAIGAVFEQTRVPAAACSGRRISIGSPSSGDELLPDAAIHSQPQPFDHLMSLFPGNRLGPYDILGPLDARPHGQSA